MTIETISTNYSSTQTSVNDEQAPIPGLGKVSLVFLNTCPRLIELDIKFKSEGKVIHINPFSLNSNERKIIDLTFSENDSPKNGEILVTMVAHEGAKKSYHVDRKNLNLSENSIATLRIFEWSEPRYGENNGKYCGQLLRVRLK